MSEFDPARRPEQMPGAPRPSRASALLLWMLSALGLLATALIEIPLVRVMPNLDAHALLLLISLIYYLPFMALPAYLLTRRQERLWQAYRPYSITFTQMITAISMALLAVFLFTDLSALWTILLEALGVPLSGAGALLPGTSRQLVLYLIQLALLAPVCEEFLFRGVILSAHERYGTRYAILVSALLFALLHGSIEGFPAQFLLGIIMGWLVVCCDSIYAGIIFHMSYNAAVTIIQFVASRAVSPEKLTGDMTMLDAIGGPAALAALAVEVLLLGAMMLFSLRVLRMTARLRGISFTPNQPRDRLRGAEIALLALGVLFVVLLFASSLLAGFLAGDAA